MRPASDRIRLYIASWTQAFLLELRSPPDSGVISAASQRPLTQFIFGFFMLP